MKTNRKEQGESSTNVQKRRELLMMPHKNLEFVVMIGDSV